MVLPVAAQRHLAVGNINFDMTMYLNSMPGPDEVVVAVEHWSGLGGAAANYSVALARWGGESYLLGYTGSDPLSDSLLDALRREGVRLDYVRRVDGSQPGLVVVLVVRSRSTRSMVKARGANEHLDRMEDFPEFDGHIHVTSANPRLVALARRANEGATISFDPGGEAFTRPRLVVEAAGHADWVMLNEWELMRASRGDPEAFIEDVLKRGARMVVVKHGRGGASLYSERGCIRVDAPRNPRVVDVTGAGDAFDAAFNAAVLAGMEPGEALRVAVAAGSAKVSRLGSSNMPSLGEVEEFLGATPEPVECGPSVE